MIIPCIFVGNVVTPIPVSQIQAENFTPSLVSHQTVVSTKSPTIQKTGQKRSHSNTPKEKTARKKVSKKPKVTPQQNFTASLGTHRSGNLHGQRFSAPLQGKVSIAGSTATLQRLSSGTFVLSGTSGGQVKLQNGSNIVYLQQLTSSGGTTQVIQTPLIANSNGTFSTLSLATCSIPNIVTTASIGPAPTTAITASATASGLVLSTMDLSKTTQSSNLITTSTIPRLSSIESPLPVSTSTSTPKQVPKQIIPSSVLEMEAVTTTTTTATTSGAIQSSNVDSETSETLPNLPSSLANLILSLPSVTTSGFSAEANAQAQSILQRLSEEDIKTLVTVLAKSTPNSPASSPAMTPDHGRSPIQSPRTPSTPSPLSDFFPPQSSHAADNKSKLMSIVDPKTSPSSQSPMSTASNKVPHKINSHPLSLTQKVSAMQQDINKLRSPRLKAPRIITTGLSGKIQSPNTSVSASSSSLIGSNKQIHTKTQKVPITITIPISRLPSSLQLTTSNSKTINVPALSAYLAQQKFVLSTGKSSSLDSRTVLLGSSSSNKRLSGIMVSTNSTKGSTVFKTAQKDSSASKSAATITLHLPSQKETPLKKAASDIKLVGVLNQKNKTQLVSASSIRPSSLPASPKSSPASPSASTGELSPIQPRQVEEASEIEPMKPSSPDDCIDDSDIDFSVIPTGKSTLLSHSHQPQQHRSGTIRASFPTSSNISLIPSTTTIATMPLAVNSKIIRVPVSSGDRRLFGSKNLLEFNKAKSAENQLMNSARKVGVAFQQVVKNSEVNKQQQLTNNDASISSRISTGITSSLALGAGSSTATNGKLRFEPLHLPGSSRPNYSAVLSSMSASDDVGSSSTSSSSVGRNTILAKPTVVNSKAAAMIARTAFITDNKLSNNKTASISFSPLSKNMVVASGATKTTTPALFSGGGKSNQAIGSPLSTPAATIRTAATTSKVLPVTIKSNDFIRMSSQVRTVQPNHTRTVLTSIASSTIVPSSFIQTASSSNNKFIKKETLIKVDPKPPKQQKKAIEVKIPEPKEEPPPPYITRSGRVLRSRYPYSDEVERKASPRKRRRNSSTSKEEATPPVTHPLAASSVTMGNIGSSLDSLVEAAKLITTNQEASENCAVEPPASLDIVTSTPPSSTTTTTTGLSHIDSTTNMAATAMLELLASNATILPPAQTVDPPLHQDFNSGTNGTVKSSVVEFDDNSIPGTDAPADQQPTKVIDESKENTSQSPKLDVPSPIISLTSSHTETEDIHPRFEEMKNGTEVVSVTNEALNENNAPIIKTDDKSEDCKIEIPVSTNTDKEQQKNDEISLPSKEEVSIPSSAVDASSISSSTTISEE